MNKNLYRFATIAFVLSGLVFLAIGLIEGELIGGALGVSFMGTGGMYFYLGRSAARDKSKESPPGAAQLGDVD